MNYSYFKSPYEPFMFVIMVNSSVGMLGYAFFISNDTNRIPPLNKILFTVLITSTVFLMLNILGSPIKRNSVVFFCDKLSEFLKNQDILPIFYKFGRRI